MASPSAMPRSPPPAPRWTGPTRLSRCPPRSMPQWDARASGAQSAGDVGRPVRAVPEGLPRSGRRLRAAHARSDCRPALTMPYDCGARQCHQQGRKDRHPQGLAECAQRLRPGPARAARRLGRPHRQQPDRLRRRARRCARWLKIRMCARLEGPSHQFRGTRVRHGRHPEWPGPARRFHPLRRHLPDLLRLFAQCHSHGRA